MKIIESIYTKTIKFRNNLNIRKEIVKSGIKFNRMILIDDQLSAPPLISFVGEKQTTLLVNTNDCWKIESAMPYFSLATKSNLNSGLLGPLLDKSTLTFLYDISSHYFMLSRTNTTVDTLVKGYEILKSNNLIKLNPEIAIKGVIVLDPKFNIIGLSPTPYITSPHKIDFSKIDTMFYQLSLGLIKLGCSRRSLIYDYPNPDSPIMSFYFKTNNIISLGDLLDKSKQSTLNEMISYEN